MAEPIEIQVTCIVTEQQPDGSERVSQLGGQGWQKMTSDVVYEIVLGVSIYYIVVAGERAEIHVVTPQGMTPYLRTSNDTTTNNNLLYPAPMSAATDSPRVVRQGPTNQPYTRPTA